jgi:hypothetical protein
MPRKSLKVLQAEAALNNMEGLREIAEENREHRGNADANATYQYQARSLKGWADTVRAGGLELPSWYVLNLKYFKAMGAA